jgi:hypothetical protein
MRRGGGVSLQCIPGRQAQRQHYNTRTLCKENKIKRSNTENVFHNNKHRDLEEEEEEEEEAQ